MSTITWYFGAVCGLEASANRTGGTLGECGWNQGDEGSAVDKPFLLGDGVRDMQ